MWRLRGLQPDPFLKVHRWMPVVLARLHRVPTAAFLWASTFRRHAAARTEPQHTHPLAVVDPPQSSGSLEHLPQRSPRRGPRPRDSWAWTDLLTLQSLVIPSPARGGTSRTRRSTNETRRRCQVWLNGASLELFDPPNGLPPGIPTQGQRETQEPSFELDDRTAARVHTLISESQKELFAGRARPAHLNRLWSLREKLSTSSDACTLVQQRHTARTSTSSAL